MRKLLVRLLAAVLLLQFSWIAAAVGCMHEKDPPSRHFGHHAHVHKAEQGKDLSKHGKNSVPDDDCAVCHLGCCAVPASDMTLAVGTAQEVAPHGVTQLHATARPDIPDRPRWARLA